MMRPDRGIGEEKVMLKGTIGGLSLAVAGWSPAEFYMKLSIRNSAEAFGGTSWETISRKREGGESSTTVTIWTMYWDVPI